MARRIEVPIIGDVSQYQRALRQAQGTTSKFGAVAKAALVSGAAAGMYALGKAAKIGWDEFNQGQKVAAQTNAVLKSTGGVANVTAQHVEDLGHALMLKSGADDEAIKSGENVLLTFTKIRNEAGKGNDIFDQATKLTLDLSTALGTDMQSAAIQVGKALQDPVRGITALRRVGVAFDDQQQEMINRLVEAGKTMKAQKMILAELRKEFGGSAEAAGKTFGGQLSILRERLNNFLGDLTEKAIPTLQRLIKWLGPRLSEVMKRAQEFTAVLRQRWNQLGAVLEEHQGTVRVLARAIDIAAKAVSIWIKWQIILWGTILKVEIAAVKVALVIGDKLVAAYHAVAGAARTAGSALSSAFRTVAAIVMTVVNAVQTLISWIQRIPSPHFSLPDPTPGFDVPGVPFFDKGGVVPGRRGAPRLIMAHGGETVLPTHKGGGGMTVNLVLDRRVLASVLVDMDNAHRKRNGGRPLFA